MDYSLIPFEDTEPTGLKVDIAACLEKARLSEARSEFPTTMFLCLGSPLSVFLVSEFYCRVFMSLSLVIF